MAPTRCSKSNNPWRLPIHQANQYCLFSRLLWPLYTNYGHAGKLSGINLQHAGYIPLQRQSTLKWNNAIFNNYRDGFYAIDFYRWSLWYEFWHKWKKPVGDAWITLVLWVSNSLDSDDFDSRRHVYIFQTQELVVTRFLQPSHIYKQLTRTFYANIFSGPTRHHVFRIYWPNRLTSIRFQSKAYTLQIALILFLHKFTIATSLFFHE